MYIIFHPKNNFNRFPKMSIYYLLTVTLEELLDIADAIRPYMEQAMKIEVAPWIRDYVVNMEELYTELVLEKINNRPFGQQTDILGDYRELFKKDIVSDTLQGPTATKRLRVDDPNMTSKPKRPVAHKIVIKGDPGMGKTTLCKKIAWDWARNYFLMFPMVFFVYLKLVKRQDVIENIIIEQSPFIKGLNITEGKIGSILKNYGSKCLLILDGLDEHALGTNDDVFKIIRGEKYLTCNTIVTSRPHSTSGIEPHFPVIARVEGFTKNKAHQFASKIVRDEQKIAAVLDFNPADHRDDVPIYKCPILLSFMCLLVNEDNIDLSDKTIHTGEIYTKMVRCLYRKFTIRKGIGFDNSKFLNDVFLIGKMALKTLLSGNRMLKRTDVIQEVGPDAFDYGLLIGHEDFRLIRDETSDIYVTFPHRSIQEFLGAFYLICELHKGSQIETVLGTDEKNLIFMKNPLFLQFCLWFLCDSKKYFDFHRGQDIYIYLRDFCVNRVNGVDLDIPHIRRTYAALDVKAAHDRNHQLRLNFLRDIFANCDQMRGIEVDVYDPLDWILNSLALLLKKVTRIQCSNTNPISTSNESEFRISYLQGPNIVIDLNTTKSIREKKKIVDELKTILKHFVTPVDNPSLFLYLNKPLFGSSLVNCKALYVKCEADAAFPLECSPYLTHLSFEAKVWTNTFRKGIKYLCEAGKNGFLPSLSHLSINNYAKSNVPLEQLFRSSWPQLRHLSLLKTKLLEADLEALCLACSGPEKTLPHLTSLFLSISDQITKEAFNSKFFGLDWSNLKSFYFDYSLSNSDIHTCLTQKMRDNKLTHLTTLAILANSKNQQFVDGCDHLEKLVNLKCLYFWYVPFGVGDSFQVPIATLSRLSDLGLYNCKGISGRLSTLFANQLPSLNTLTLRDCGLNSQDMRSLAKANLEGRLPIIKHLDISRNEMSLSELRSLFDGSCGWNQLLSLDIKRTTNRTNRRGLTKEEYNISDYLNTVVQQGKLLSLQHLGINSYRNADTVWSKLERICMKFCDEETLRNITSVRSAFLPALHTLCIVHYDGYDARVTSTLSEMGVNCHAFCAPWDDPFYPGKCHCQGKLD